MGEKFSSGFGSPEGPIFLTKTDTLSNNQQVVLLNGNFFVVGSMELPNFPYTGRPTESESGDLIRAVNLKTKKKVWEYLSFGENPITGFELSENRAIAHYKVPLNLRKGKQAIDLKTGKKIEAFPAPFKQPYSYYNRPRSWGKGYKDHFLRINTERKQFLLKYNRDRLVVYLEGE